MPKNKRKEVSRPKPRETHLPRDAFEEWIRTQSVKPAPGVPEVRVLTDSYEEWISRQIKRKLEEK